MLPYHLGASTHTRNPLTHVSNTVAGKPSTPKAMINMARHRTQTVNINTQVTGTMAESMYQANETEIVGGWREVVN